LGENIADNGGLKQAYKAYQSWIAQNSEEMTLPGFEKFSPNQLFWISAAANWCSVTREERLKSNILSGVHSPGEWRVRGSFSNSKDFAKDWNCVEGVDEMHPKDKCMVW
jgi:predicted metalloendopeptidase